MLRQNRTCIFSRLGMITGIEGAVTLLASVHSAKSGAKKTYKASVSTRDRMLVEISRNCPEIIETLFL